MVEDYKIQFAPYPAFKKELCPQCGKSKRFTRFIDAETGDLFPLPFGRCDREQKCGYHNRPDVSNKIAAPAYTPPPPKPIDFLEMRHVQARMDNFGNNDFFTWLKKTLGVAEFQRLQSDYRLGTSLRHRNFVSFPQIDVEGNLRNLKEMAYNKKTGRRLKEGRSFYWPFNKDEFPHLNLQQVYFGSHLLKERPDMKVAIVESEKTALICSHYLKDYIWLATGSLGMLTEERCKDLKGRHLTLFPDLGAYDAWKKKSKWIKGMASIQVSDYLEKNATDEMRAKGWDLADFLLEADGKNHAS